MPLPREWILAFCLNLWYTSSPDRNMAPLQPSSQSQFAEEGSVEEWQSTPI